MAVWAMLLGMATMIAVTMVGAIMQVAGNIPDIALLRILSRYLKKKEDPPEVVLHPWEAASRLARLRKRMLGACVAAAALGAGLSMWALTAGWGAEAMSAVTFLVVAGNLLFATIAPAGWRRRVMRMNAEMGEEESGGPQSPPRDGDA